jgi:hypothetical protein
MLLASMRVAQRSHEGFRGGFGFGTERSRSFISIALPARTSARARWRICSMWLSGLVLGAGGGGGATTSLSRLRRSSTSLALLHKGDARSAREFFYGHSFEFSPGRRTLRFLRRNKLRPATLIIRA